MEQTKKCRRKISQPLTLEERDERNKRLLDALDRTDELEDEMAEAKSAVKAKQDQNDKLIKDLRRAVKKGEEERMVDCEEYWRAGTIVTKRLDTNTEIDVRAPTMAEEEEWNKDRQGTLPIVPKDGPNVETPEQAAAASEDKDGKPLVNLKAERAKRSKKEPEKLEDTSGIVEDAAGAKQPDMPPVPEAPKADAETKPGEAPAPGTPEGEFPV